METQYYIFIVFIIALATFIIRRTIRFNRTKSKKVYEIIPHEFVAELNKEIAARINMLRSDESKTPLISDKKATELAKNRCKEMIKEGKISHDGFDDEMSELIQLGADGVGENVAYGYGSAKTLITAYNKSEGHRKNMLAKFDAMGNWAEKDKNGRYYFCTIFISEFNL